MNRNKNEKFLIKQTIIAQVFLLLSLRRVGNTQYTFILGTCISQICVRQTDALKYSFSLSHFEYDALLFIVL